MKAILLIAVLFLSTYVLSQTSCCAPDDWRTNFRAFINTGYSMEGYVVYSQNLNLGYTSSYYSPDTNVQIWEDANNNFTYVYQQTGNQSICQKYNLTQSIVDLNLCVGQTNQFVSTINVAETAGSVWSSQSGGVTSFVTVTQNCVPIGISSDNSSNIGYQFDESFVFFNFSRNDLNIPPLPSNCPNALSAVERLPLPKSSSSFGILSGLFSLKKKISFSQ
eukprot:TRINITY_DN2153_c0_g1_i1.p1 TRINITY_DN2153_c0_g1~~TRINITY_DN2153_c0_g1_i1.p1  ORF type:complete len:220 (+),score=62.44 TRINITY_DN2153_c0_g1_i1:2-661(+)